MNKIIKDLPLIAALLFAVSGSASAQDSWAWTQRYESPKGLNSVAAGANGIFVAVGTAGTILSSPNGVDWTERNSGTNNGLYSVIWGDGIFAAGGDSGTIVTSANGAEWTVRRSGGGAKIQSIAWGNGKYVAVCGESYVVPSIEIPFFTSGNAIDWIEQPSLTDGGYGYVIRENIVYGDGLFMTGTCGLPVSTDVVHWERSNVAINLFDCSRPGDPTPMPACENVKSIAYGNELFLWLNNYGELARYKNGAGWKALHYECDWSNRVGIDGHSIFYDGTRFIVTGNEGIYFTENGDVLERVSTISLQNGTSMAYNGSVYVIVNGTKIGTLSIPTNVSNPKQNASRTAAPLVTVRGRTLSVNAGAGSEVRIRVMTLTGRTAASFNAVGGAKLSLKNFPSGAYVIEAKRAADGRRVTSAVLLR